MSEIVIGGKEMRLSHIKVCPESCIETTPPYLGYCITEKSRHFVLDKMESISVKHEFTEDEIILLFYDNLGNVLFENIKKNIFFENNNFVIADSRCELLLYSYEEYIYEHFPRIKNFNSTYGQKSKIAMSLNDTDISPILKLLLNRVVADIPKYKTEIQLGDVDFCSST